MELTIKDLLKMDLLKDAIVYDCGNGINHKISSVNIIESPNIVKFMHPSELLLTGMYAFKESSMAQFKSYMKKMIENQICGLIIKIPFEKSELLKSQDKIEYLHQFSEQYQFPILEIPYKVSFRDLMIDINERLFNEEVTFLKYFKMSHENFSAMISSGVQAEGIRQILDVLSNMVDNPVAFFDSDRNCIYASNPQVEQLIFKNDSNNIKLDFYSSNRYMTQNVKFDEESDETYRQIFVYVKGYQHQTMYLTVTGMDSSLSNLDVVAVENALAAINQLWIRQQLVQETRKKLHDDAWNNILYGKISTLADYQKVGRTLGIDVASRYRVIALEISFASILEKYKGNGPAAFNVMVRDIIAKEFSEDCIVDDSERILIIQVDPQRNTLSDIKVNLRNKLQRIVKNLGRIASIDQLKCGVGNEIESLNNAQKSFGQSIQALRFATMLGERTENAKQNILFFSDMSIFQLLGNLSDASEAEQYIPESVRRLYEYNKPQRDDLILTLKTYLDYSQNLTKTAQALFVHYKTAAYRVDRIAKITGIDFNNPREVLSAQIGLIIGEVARTMTWK